MTNFVTQFLQLLEEKDDWRKYIDKKDMLEAAERAVFVQ